MERDEVIAPHGLQEEKFMELEKSLLSGICDTVTLELIATKLPWTTFNTLSLVSTAWRQAIQDGLVSDARVRAHSGENFVIISHTKSTPGSRPNAILLYSLRNKTCHQLPPIPQVESGFPYDCECIALDGKVYILGGSKKCCYEYLHLGSKAVYVLDLAGQRQWKPCARMEEARANFRCGVKDGKIYVFGGTSGKRWVLGSEVYDPSIDAWSAITPMESWGFKRETNFLPNFSLETLRRWSGLKNAVTTVGEELLVYHHGQIHELRVYCPVTDKWRTLYEDFRLDHSEFTAQGKIHAMSTDNILIYDVERNEWTKRHSWSSFGTVPRRFLKSEPISILAVDDEILAILDRWTEKTAAWSPFLVQSKGFGSEDEHIVWEELPYPLRYGNPLRYGRPNPQCVFLNFEQTRTVKFLFIFRWAIFHMQGRSRALVRNSCRMTASPLNTRFCVAWDQSDARYVFQFVAHFRKVENFRKLPFCKFHRHAMRPTKTGSK